MKSFLGTFIAIWRLFTGHTASRTFALDFPPKFSFPWSAAILDKLYIPILGILSYLSSPHFGLVTKYTVTCTIFNYIIFQPACGSRIRTHSLTIKWSWGQDVTTAPELAQKCTKYFIPQHWRQGGKVRIGRRGYLEIVFKTDTKIGSICMAIFQSCLTIWSIQLFISFYKRAPWLER